MSLIPTRSALVAGPTGAVGQLLVQQLLANPSYHQVKALTRRPLGFSHPKLVELPLPRANETGVPPELRADDFFCCLGTTLKKAGSRAAFEQVDYHLVLQLARLALAAGAQQMLVVSAAGSSLKALSFYSRVKARMEAAVQALGFTSLHILRPSILIAERSESRPGERLAILAAPLLNPLLMGKLSIYRAISVAEVASAMITLALRNSAGTQIHHLPLAP